MRENKSKSRPLRGLRSLFLIACIISTIGVVYVQHGVYSYERAVADEFLYLINTQAAIQEELRLEIEYNLSDKYIERVAREQWGFLKSNEIVFINLHN